MMTARWAELPPRRWIAAVAGGIIILLTLSGLVWLSSPGAAAGRVKNETEARARYKLTGQLINKEEAILIAKEHLRRTGNLPNEMWLDWEGDITCGVWVVEVSTRPATPGGYTIATITQKGAVLGFHGGE